MKRKIFSVLCAVLMVLVFSVSAYAIETVDLTRTGSITITMLYDGQAVPGGSLTAYRVAEVFEDDANFGYRFTDAFASCGLSLDSLSAELASGLADFATEHSLAGTKQSIGEDGSVRFSDLELGLYLFIQEDAAEGYQNVLPILISVPGKSDEGYLYDVDGSPKLSLVPAPTETETETTESETTQPTEPKLPQTGQMNWPIPVLALSGISIFVIGWCMRRSGKERYEG